MSIIDNDHGQGDHKDRFALITGKTNRLARLPPNLGVAAVYSRYSTVNQHEVSIERQEEVSTEYALKTGRSIFAKYADRARSGYYEAGREELARMVKDAKDGKFGVLIVENVDRLARDLSILSTIYKQLLAVGVEMHMPGRGRLTLPDIALHGLLGDETRRVMGERTHFSRIVMAREGRFPTGKCLGYDKAPGGRGEIVINEAEAEIVRRIYAMRLAGIGYRPITSALHAEGFRNPRSGKLTKRGIQVILANPRYTGLLVYRRHVSTRDRDTGKTTVDLRPRSEWIITEVRHLRIVEQDVWDRVQALNAERGGAKTKPPLRFGSYLLTDLVPCPVCRRPMGTRTWAENTKRFACNRHWADDTCPSNLTISVPRLERLVFDLIAELLDRKGYVEAYVKAYNDERIAADSRHAKTRDVLQRTVVRLDRQLRDSFLQSTSRGITSDRTARYRMEIEEELSKAEVELSAMPRLPARATLDRAWMTSLRDAIANLSHDGPFQARDEAGLLVTAAIHALVERIEVRSTGFRAFEASVTLRMGPMLDASGQGDAAFGTVVLAGTSERPGKGYRHSRGYADDIARQARGEFAMGDADWHAVRHLYPHHRMGQRIDDVECRATVDAMVFRGLTGARWRHMPPSLGGDRRFRRSLRVQSTGAWTSIVSILAERDAERFGRLDPTWPPARSKKGTRRPRRAADAGDGPQGETIGLAREETRRSSGARIACVPG